MTTEDHSDGPDDPDYDPSTFAEAGVRLQEESNRAIRYVDELTERRETTAGNDVAEETWTRLLVEIGASESRLMPLSGWQIRALRLADNPHQPTASCRRRREASEVLEPGK